MAADALPQGGLQQVRGRVVALGGVPGEVIHARQHRLAGAQGALLERDNERLVLAESQDVLDARPAVAVLAFDRAAVGYLAAAAGVEGRLVELNQVPRAHRGAVAVGPVRGDALQRADRGLLLLGLIAREAGRNAALARERARRVARLAGVRRRERPGPGEGARAAARALLLHQLIKVSPDHQPLFGQPRAGHLVRHAVCAIPPE